MRYWAYLLAKLAVAGAVLYGIWFVIHAQWPRPQSAIYGDPFAHDLGYTTVMMVFSLLCSGVLYLIIRDQRYRCRTCLRKLRMPVSAGSWPNMLLFGQPRTEYICLYGHGTLKVPELKITKTTPDWEPHDDDIWKELESLEASKR